MATFPPPSHIDEFQKKDTSLTANNNNVPTVLEATQLLNYPSS